MTVYFNLVKSAPTAVPSLCFFYCLEGIILIALFGHTAGDLH